MTDTRQAAIDHVLQVIPLVMRALGGELRRAAHTLAPMHFHLLTLLAEHPHNLSELAERQEVSLPSMSHSVATLVERGWVMRTQDTRDRRMVIIELAPEGYKVLENLHQTLQQEVTQRLACLSVQECERLLDGLELLHAAFAADGQDHPCAAGLTCGRKPD